MAALRAVLVLGLAVQVACLSPVRGVVQPTAASVQVVDLEGRRYKLLLGDAGQPLRYLEGCVVDVEGPLVGRRVVVRDWTVITAEDGSAPYVGRLKRQGSNLVMEDRNSGSIIVLQADPRLGLSEWVDQPVMVVGYITGPHQVQVVGFRGLGPNPSATGVRP